MSGHEQQIAASDWSVDPLKGNGMVAGAPPKTRSVYQIADCMLPMSDALLRMGAAAGALLDLICCRGRKGGRHIPYFAVVYRNGP